jgi:dihydropteroate synthase
MSLLVFEFYLQLLGGKVVKDVTALRVEPQLAKVIVEYQVPVILMFSKDSTSPTITLQSDYEDMLYTLKSFFRERLHFANSKGVLKIHIVLDQGMGVFQWCYKIQLYDHQENFKTA